MKQVKHHDGFFQSHIKYKLNKRKTQILKIFHRLSHYFLQRLVIVLPSFPAIVARGELHFKCLFGWGGWGEVVFCFFFVFFVLTFWFIPHQFSGI